VRGWRQGGREEKILNFVFFVYFVDKKDFKKSPPIHPHPKGEKKMRPTSSTSGQLDSAQLAINNSLSDPEIMALVGGYGYSAEKLAEGKALFDAAQAAVNAQGLAAGKQKTATAAFNDAQTQAFDTFQALAKVARAAVTDPGQLKVLGLEGPMPRKTGAFRNAASQLFENAASIPALAQFGYNAARISAEAAKLVAYVNANEQQESAKGAAKQATTDQDAALTALNKWTAQYIKIAQVALRAKPDLLKKLGVTARSGPAAAAAKKQQPPTTTTTS
jgi:hypothetical protein